MEECSNIDLIDEFIPKPDGKLFYQLSLLIYSHKTLTLSFI